MNRHARSSKASSGSGWTYDEELVFQSQNAERHRAAAGGWWRKAKPIAILRPGHSAMINRVKQGIVDRARAHAADGIDHRSNPYRDLSEEESDRRAATDEPFAIRLKVAPEGVSRFADIVYGDQERAFCRD